MITPESERPGPRANEAGTLLARTPSKKNGTDMDPTSRITDSQLPTTHPAWCSRDLCCADETGVTHSSAPRTVTLGEETLTLYLVQDHLAGSEPKRTEVHVNSARSEHEWPADDVCELAAALTSMFHRAHLLRSQVQVAGDAA